MRYLKILIVTIPLILLLTSLNEENELELVLNIELNGSRLESLNDENKVTISYNDSLLSDCNLSGNVFKIQEVSDSLIINIEFKDLIINTKKYSFDELKRLNGFNLRILYGKRAINKDVINKI